MMSKLKSFSAPTDAFTIDKVGTMANRKANAKQKTHKDTRSDPRKLELYNRQKSSNHLPVINISFKVNLCVDLIRFIRSFSNSSTHFHYIPWGSSRTF